MYIPLTYDKDFDELWMYLKSKYPIELFDTDGIGSQLDMSEFSKQFFSSSVTADASIDANANVDDMSVIAYDKELPKPYAKLNSYYITWKELKKQFGRPYANEVIESQLVGDIYINDAHGIAAGKPYSYHPTMFITADHGAYNYYCSFLELWRYMRNTEEYEVETTSDSEFMNLEKKGWTVVDADGASIPLMRILRHKPHNDVLELMVKGGDALVVTEDHPIILEDGTEIFVNDMNVEIIEDGLAVIQDADEEENIEDNKITYRLAMTDEWYKEHDAEDSELVSVKRVKKPTWVYDITTATGHFACMNFKAHNCFNYSTYDVMTRGLPMVKKVKCSPPKYLYSFKSQLEQFVTVASNSTLGATGIADMLIMMSYYVQRMLKTHKDAHFTLASDDDVWAYVKENLVSFIYTINQPMRGNQCVTEDTEVLTPQGFKKYDELMIGDEIFTLSEDAGIKVSQVRRVFVDDYDGEMHHYWTDEDGEWNVDCIVTPNHKVVLLNPNRTDEKSMQLAVIPSEELMKVLEGDGEFDRFPIPLLKQMSENNFGIDVGVARHWERIPYKGKIWCPTTDEGIVIFRRNGTVFVSGNSPFTNVSIYDDNFLDKLCDDYVFPDGSTPDKEIVKQIQDLYIDVMNDELERTPLTFPVTTACFSIDENREIRDKAFLRKIAEKNLKWGFINLYAGDSSTLSSCCRLRSEQKSEYFNSFGSGSSKIGSLGVCTINFPRLAIKYPVADDFIEELKKLVIMSARVNFAKRSIIKERIANGNEPLYDHGFAELSKQYSTVGVNGFYEAIKYLGEDILTPDGQALAVRILDAINETNKECQDKYHAPHNVEQVPGENLSIKLAVKDRMLGYQNEYDIYSNQFIPLISNADLLDRIKLQGLFDSHFSGGSICHLNVETQIEDVNAMVELIEVAAKMGVVYFAINYVLSQCEDGHMCVTNGDVCTVCGKPITDKYTRVVGFLTNVKNWHKVRRQQDFPNRKFYHGIEITDKPAAISNEGSAISSEG